jgi:TolB-like protein
MPGLQLKLLGGFELLDIAGTEIRIGSKKVRGLIGYLALNPDRRHGRGTLANLLWGDRFEAQARQSLRQALLTLRKLLADLAPDALRTDGDAVSLCGAAIRTDVFEFERLVRERNLEDAARAYTGDLIDGLEVLSSPFDTWLAEERVRLRDLACEAWEALGVHRLQEGETKAAIDAGKRLIALDPLCEPGHRLLMRAYVMAGRRAEALQDYQTFTDTLGRELGAEPDPETTQLIEVIRDTETPRPLDPDKPSIAVLPFVNMSDDPEQEYFADGITEDIITELAKFRSIFVIDRNSSFEYKGRSVNIRAIGRDLGVQYVVEGGVRKAGEQVRVTAQLVEAKTGNHLWAERYDRDREGLFKGIFAIQDEITQAIATAVETEIGNAEGERVQ